MATACLTVNCLLRVEIDGLSRKQAVNTAVRVASTGQGLQPEVPVTRPTR